MNAVEVFLDVSIAVQEEVQQREVERRIRTVNLSTQVSHIQREDLPGTLSSMPECPCNPADWILC
jgi:hypothetical protein